VGKVDISIIALPDRLVNDGECKSKIVVEVLENGKPAKHKKLFLSSSDGQIYSLDSPDEEPAAPVQPLELETDEKGSASAGIRLPNRVGTVHLVAGLKGSDVDAVISDLKKGGEVKPRKNTGVGQVTLLSDEPAVLTVEAEPREVVADGVSVSMLVAKVLDRFGNPVSGQEVSFYSDLGTVDPDRVNCLTDSEGKAESSITSDKVGVATVTVTNQYRSWLEEILPMDRGRKNGLLGILKSEDEELSARNSRRVLTEKIQVRFISSKPSTLVLAADRTRIPADGKTEALVTAVLRDEFGNPVEGEELVFETDLGEISPSPKRRTDAEGKAEVRLRSTRVGAASVRARTTGDSPLLAGAEVLFEPSSPARVSVTAGPQVLVADAETGAVVRAKVEDESGNPVPDKNVVFQTTLGSIAGDDSQLTDAEGTAEVRVISARAGTALVTASCEGIQGTVEITFKPGSPSSIAFSLNPMVEDRWRSRLDDDYLSAMRQAALALKERKFNEAASILEVRRDTLVKTNNYAAVCNLAYAYQQAGDKKKAQDLYRMVIDVLGSGRKITVKAGSLRRSYVAKFPHGPESDDYEFIPIRPKDFQISAAVTDGNGNAITDLSVEFAANFGWIPDELKKSKTNFVGAATSVVTVFVPEGFSELEFAWVNLGQMKENALDYEGAEQCYRAAISAAPDSVRALESLASLLVKTGNSEMAKKVFYNLGQAYARREQLDLAIQFYNRAIQLDPSYARALSACGAAYLKMGDFNLAKRYLEESVKADKSLKAALANLGLLYYLTGKFEKAIQMNRRALKVDSAFKPALMNLHQVYNAMGERERAAEYLQRAESV